MEQNKKEAAQEVPVQEQPIYESKLGKTKIEIYDGSIRLQAPVIKLQCQQYHQN